MRYYTNNVKYDNIKWEKQQNILPVGIKVLTLHPKIISNKLMTDTKVSIFRRPAWVAGLALTAAILWGWAYPLIKLGFAEFQITPDMTGSKMLFAGIRFCISGLIILSVARATHRRFAVSKGRDWWYVLLFSLLNTTFHYAFFYFGLSHSDGARAAILNSMGVFTVVIFACMFFKSDKMTMRKALGCILGFIGILALNLGGKESGHFTWLGDGMIILNALCSAFASLMTRGLGKRVDVFVGTGYSLALGGALLILPALLMGGVLPNVTIVRMIVTKPATRPKSLNMTALRMPPTMHIRLRWQSAPTTRPATSASPHAACMLPGPFSENLKIAGAASQRTNSST